MPRGHFRTKILCAADFFFLGDFSAGCPPMIRSEGQGLCKGSPADSRNTHPQAREPLLWTGISKLSFGHSCRFRMDTYPDIHIKEKILFCHSITGAGHSFPVDKREDFSCVSPVFFFSAGSQALRFIDRRVFRRPVSIWLAPHRNVPAPEGTVICHSERTVIYHSETAVLCVQ